MSDASRSKSKKRPFPGPTENSRRRHSRPPPPQEADDNDARDDADYQQAEAAIIDATQDREEEIARLQSEIEALEFVTDTLEVVRDPDEDFSLDAIRDQR